MTRGRVNAFYSAHISLDGHECFYCGQYANTIDHVPPISLMKFYANFPRLLLKSCWECNGGLGARFLPTPLSRIEYLIKKYKRKYARLIRMPKWQADEIENLSGALRKYIVIETEAQKLIKDRLEFLGNKLGELINISQ